MDEARTVAIGEGGWPEGLNDLAESPCAGLWVRGADDRAAPEGWVAIVGTRAADPAGLRAAQEIAARVVEHGLGVISGGAMGVDAAAHLGALDACGATVAVLAGGVDRPSPARNGALFQRLLVEGGGLWSESPPGRRPHRGSFLYRNRLIAAAAVATVVVQARVRSGALSTAAHARRLGRPVGAVVGGWMDGARGGCANLVRSGSVPVCGPEDLAALLERKAKPSIESLTGDPGRVLELMRAGTRDAQGLVDATGWDLSRCLAALTELEMRGLWNA